MAKRSDENDDELLSWQLVTNDPVLDLEAFASAAGLTITVGEGQQQQVTYFDTVDGRLYRSGTVLCANPATYEQQMVCHSVSGAELHRLVLAEVPAYWRDLPECGLRNAIGPAIGERRLLETARYDQDLTAIKVRDKRDKLIARGTFASGRVFGLMGTPSEADAPCLLTLTALRGFNVETAALVEVLTQPGAMSAADDLYARLMGCLGRAPQGQSNKVAVDLDESAPIELSLARLLESFREQMVLNEAGTRADLDPEFLHDFRIAIRRTRSMLSRLKKAFPRNELEYFQHGFAWLGALTGPTRDLDVYLSKMPEFRAGLPERDRNALGEVEAFLLRSQSTEQARIAKALGKKTYRELMSRWNEYLSTSLTGRDEQPGGDAELAGRSTREVAADALWRQYRKVRRCGRNIDDNTPPDPVHRLRLECKKLRYLLDGFASVFDADGIRRLVGALKRLQDNLGDFNDYDVQQRAMRRFSTQMAESGEVSTDTLIAMGRLVERMANRQAQERALFAKRWRRFDTTEFHDFARSSFATADGEDD